MRPRVARWIAAGVLLAPALCLLDAEPASALSLQAACTGTLDTSTLTYTLTGPCHVEAPITVPAGFTLDGGGFTIDATDAGGPEWNGPIVTNEGASMNIRDVTIAGPVDGFQISHSCGNVVFGILFNDAGGTVNNVTVQHIWQQPNASGAPSCIAGNAIRAENPTAARTVTITNTKVMDYQRNGIDGRGSGMTMNVSGSTIGPPNNQEGLIAANGLVYVSGATGKATHNTIFGSGDQQPPGPPGGGTDATAVILFGAKNVTIDHNTITGAKTDLGIAVVNGSTGIVISFNHVTRTAPDVPDPTGIGIGVDPPTARTSATAAVDPKEGGSNATLICNTFANWKVNIIGAIQIDCTPLPPATCAAPYSAHTPNVEGGNAPFTWTTTAGSLPPGLTLASDGAITGTPNATGTTNFTVQVTDSTELTASQDATIPVTGDCALPVTASATGKATGNLPVTGTAPWAAMLGSALMIFGILLVARTRRRGSRTP